MKKLDDIPKKNVFQVPDDYFDHLPGRIQARIPVAAEQRPTGFFSLRYALPALLLAGIAITTLFLNQQAQVDKESAETMIASVGTEDLLAYIEDDSELSLDELLETYAFSEEDLTSIEDEVYGLPMEQEALDEWMEEYQLELNEW